MGKTTTRRLTMKYAITPHMKKYINHICSTCKHMRIKIATEEHLDPLILICGLTKEETTEGATCSKWELEDE